jgi:hypothetical protein
VFLRDRRLMLPPLALSIALVAVVAGCEPEPHAMRRTPGPSERSQAESSQVWQVKRIQTPGANPLVVGEGAIWVVGSSSGDGRADAPVLRLDPATGRVEREANFGYLHEDLVLAFGSLWVASSSGACVFYSCGMSGDSPPQTPEFPGENSLVRLDPSTLHMTEAIPLIGPYKIAAAFGSVWVSAWGTGPGSDILRIDPRTNDVIATIRVPADPGTLVEATGSLWALAKLTRGSPRGWALVRVDPDRNEVAQIIELPKLHGPMSLAAGRGDLWIGGWSGRIVRLDPETGQVTLTIDTGVPVMDVSVGPAGASVIGQREIAEIDVRSGRVEATHRIGGAPMWFARQAEGRMWIMTNQGFFEWPPS